MIDANAYAALDADTPLIPYRISRLAPGPRDVLIALDYCGVCHTDIHMARGDMGRRAFPLVPGHEIVGRVTEVGTEVTRFSVGDVVGVGCWVDSCRTCHECIAGNEQFCSRGVSTFGGRRADGTVTQGGYSSHLTVTEDFVIRIPAALDPASAAPLMCAGITTYSALRHWNCGPGRKVGVVGLGGLGHLAVKLAASMGAEATVLSRSDGKREDARRLGAREFLLTTTPDQLERYAQHFDLIVNTVSASVDYDTYLNLLQRDGTLVLLGVPDGPVVVDAFKLLRLRRSVAASPAGGLAQTQELLEYCATNGVSADVEVIPIDQVNEAYRRVLASDVRYRFVLDLASLHVGRDPRPIAG